MKNTVISNYVISNVVETKECSGCKNVYPLNREYFYYHNQNGAYYSNCRVCKIEMNKKYQKSRPEKYREYKNRKYREDETFKLNTKVSGVIKYAISLKKKSIKEGTEFKGIKSKYEKYLGYTFSDLILHIESQFNDENNFSWDNHGDVDGWELDHIKPKSSFEFSSLDSLEFKKCWDLSNLRPLDRYENNSKYTNPEPLWR